MKLSVKSGPRIRKQETAVIAAISCFFVICKSNKKTVWNQTKAQQVLCKLWKNYFHHLRIDNKKFRVILKIQK